MSEANDRTAWEREYPARDDLFSVMRAVSDARAGGPPGPAGEEAITRAQISAAFHVERLARAFMSGRQFTGVQRDKRGVVVVDAHDARTVAEAWRLRPPTPEAQAWIDRALGALRQCFARGMAVLVWDRPGYDDVTPEFLALLDFASSPEACPVVLAWDPTYHGESDAPPAAARAPRPGPPPSAVPWWPYVLLALLLAWALSRYVSCAPAPPA